MTPESALLRAVRGHLTRLRVLETAEEPAPGVVRLTDSWSGIAAHYDGARLAEALAGIKWPNRGPAAGNARDAGHEFWEGDDHPFADGGGEGGFWGWIDHARLRGAA